MMMWNVEVETETGKTRMFINANTLENAIEKLKEVTDFKRGWFHKTFQLGDVLVSEKNYEYVENI